jgi:hypothetical protein
MAELKFYTDEMRQHCRNFLNENFEKLDAQYSKVYSKEFSEKRKSATLKDTTLFDFISNSLKVGINSDYSVYEDKDFINYYLQYLNSKSWHEEMRVKQFIENPYDWVRYRPTIIPTNIRELVVNKFDLLEEFYSNCIKSDVIRFFIRGHVNTRWLKIDSVLNRGFNYYLHQFTQRAPRSEAEIRNELQNFTEGGLYGLLRNADLYGDYVDERSNRHAVQILKFDFQQTFTSHPITFNHLIDELNISPVEYLLNIKHLDIYIAQIDEPINILRERLGLPRIGEGWISETKLFYQLKQEFHDHVVLQHWKPKWLGRQHLDIYFQELNIAVEFQGAQHYNSVEYFGGREAFEQNVKRDKRKKELCEKNNCDLIYVEPGYNLSDVCELIKRAKNYPKH